MANIVIKDLEDRREIDQKALSAVWGRGPAKGALFTFPITIGRSPLPTVMNQVVNQSFEVTQNFNFIEIERLVNVDQNTFNFNTVEIAASDSVIDVNVDQSSTSNLNQGLI